MAGGPRLRRSRVDEMGEPMPKASVSHPLFARFYAWISPSMERNGGADLRKRLLVGLTGRVIEVGAGNGLNFAHYPPEVAGVLAVEPEPHLRAVAQRNASSETVSMTILLAGQAAAILAAASIPPPGMVTSSSTRSGSSSLTSRTAPSALAAWPTTTMSPLACSEFSGFSTPPSGRCAWAAAIPTATPPPRSRTRGSPSNKSTSFVFLRRASRCPRRRTSLAWRSEAEPRPSPDAGVRMAFVHDPGGNLIELIQRGA